MVTVSEQKKIVILGSTGSIGKSALEVIEALGPSCKVCALAANSNWQLLAAQARQFKPSAVAIADPACLPNLQDALKGSGIDLAGGPEAVARLAGHRQCNLGICAIVGAASITAVIQAIQAGKTLALASKEALVVAGGIIMPLARDRGVTIFPVDSEHSAIFQAMHAGTHRQIKRVTLTASGGPFRDWPAEKACNATLDQALNHPTWNMGRKITIDSATMINKALEIVEASWLFDLQGQQIDVLIHPESIIHSMVEFADGSVLAQLSHPDMRMPIQYALTYPDRLVSLARPLDLAEVGKMTFARPAGVLDQAVQLGYKVVRAGGTSGAVLNAANEAAVEAFIAGNISFGSIVQLVTESLNNHQLIENPSLEQLLQADSWARNEVQQCLNCH